MHESRFQLLYNFIKRTSNYVLIRKLTFKEHQMGPAEVAFVEVAQAWLELLASSSAAALQPATCPAAEKAETPNETIYFRRYWAPFQTHTTKIYNSK
jgi:hypothetical protein